MLFTGTLRHNLDPFKAYTDGRIKRHGRGKSMTKKWAFQWEHMEHMKNHEKSMH
jgi:hypothetical protein